MSKFKLYYTPTSCGAASFLTATIGGLEFDCEVVDLRAHKTKSGADFYAINPKGNVPTLVFDDGAILNENVATLTYLADTGNAGLAPKEGTFARYQYLNNLAFVASELHKAYSTLFNPTLSDDAREAAKTLVGKKVEHLLKILDGGKKRYLAGDSLTAADIYAHVVLGWSGFLGVTLPAAAQAYLDGIKADERVAKAATALAAKS